MVTVGVVLFLLLAFGLTTLQANDADLIKQLVIQWAPLVWISPEEKYYPSSINHFLKNVQLVNENGKTIMLPINGTDIPQYNTKSLQLVTTCDLDSLIKSGNSFLNGHIPKMYSVPTYAIISPCSPNSSFRANILYKKTNPNLYFSVSYWTFYPFNKGKDICFLGKVPVVPIFGRCFGHRTTIGSHVGDWEHMTLFFNGNPFPSEMYIAIHNTGGYYTLAPHQQHFKFDVYRKVLNQTSPHCANQGGHPVLFSATGSHGLLRPLENTRGGHHWRGLGIGKRERRKHLQCCFGACMKPVEGRENLRQKSDSLLHQKLRECNGKLHQDVEGFART
ncbi:hypothetical protein Zmor_002411 [Zophobas morio]|uniref:Uncharacterized protein n=1 Tax=Zophobas morio TaxID=2755281 RepID=A0AA38J4F7_9CUCU|nr:hypothetical protein Zmor_002411 [Zophobas morio]